MATKELDFEGISTLLDEHFWPTEPSTLKETGLPVSLLESLVVKLLHSAGSCSGRIISKHLCLPFRLLEELFANLRSR